MDDNLCPKPAPAPAKPLTISQKLYDDSVKELMVELNLSREDAIEEANKQFEAQGVDLTRIIKSLTVKDDVPLEVHIIKESVAQLTEVVKRDKQPPYEYLTRLTVLKRECDKGIEYKVLAGKEGAYPAIIQSLLINQDNAEIKTECLKTLLTLMSKQPDLLDDTGVSAIINLLKTETDLEIQRLTLKWTKECCIMHEMNRQKLFSANILAAINPLLNSEAGPGLLRDILGVLRALVLDDDVRVELGKAPERAKVIATDMLGSITALLLQYKGDETLMNDLMLTIAALLVRSEFCKQVEDAGGIEIITDTLTFFNDNDKLSRMCFKLIKALAGNDSSKVSFIKKGAAPIMVKALDTNKESPQTVASGFGAIAALTLRSPDNSKAFFDAGIPDIIVDCMKLYPDDQNVQKNACWAIRNMVSRSRYQTKKFLKLGVEQILKNDLKKFSDIEFDIKSALRDLGCKVDLKEAWTGKGGLLTTQSAEGEEMQETPQKCV